MGVTICPNCNRTIGKAFWEVMEACPDCGQKFAVHHDEQARVNKRVAVWAVTCAVLSFIPVVGVVFGFAGVFMGVVAFRLGRAKVGLSSAFVALVVGLAGQGLLTYWGIGHYSEKICQANMNRLADSMYTYRALTHRYPQTIKDMADVRLAAPKGCPLGGGDYLYMSPEALADQASTKPASAAAMGGESQTVIVAEVLGEHRHHRVCMTSDLVVHLVPHAEFERLMNLPRNSVFGQKLHVTWRNTTQPAPKPASTKPASQPATATAPSPVTTSPAALLPSTQAAR